jgi:predicted TIM-barrel fold metal-dependent hydrolase
MSELYSGPIIDAHIHLWDLGGGSYPWLSPEGAFGPAGMLDSLKGKDYLLDDYRSDITGQGVVAAVHIEALWEPVDEKINETRWLETLDKSDNIAIRYVAGVPFGTPQTESMLREQAAIARVKAVRQVIAWTPYPDRTMVSEPEIARGAEWRAALPLLVELGLALEILMYPWQAEQVAELAALHPDLAIIIDHIGSPIEQTPEGLAMWTAGLATMAAAPNVVIKVSSAAGYLTDPGVPGLQGLITTVVDAFGPSRVMVGSDFPVGGIIGWSYAKYFDAYRECLLGYTEAEQYAMFCGNAARVYGIDLAVLLG